MEKLKKWEREEKMIFLLSLSLFFFSSSFFSSFLSIAPHAYGIEKDRRAYRKMTNAKGRHDGGRKTAEVEIDKH